MTELHREKYAFPISHRYDRKKHWKHQFQVHSDLHALEPCMPCCSDWHLNFRYLNLCSSQTLPPTSSLLMFLHYKARMYWNCVRHEHERWVYMYIYVLFNTVHIGVLPTIATQTSDMLNGSLRLFLSSTCKAMHKHKNWCWRRQNVFPNHSSQRSNLPLWLGCMERQTAVHRMLGPSSSSCMIEDLTQTLTLGRHSKHVDRPHASSMNKVCVFVYFK